MVCNNKPCSHFLELNSSTVPSFRQRRSQQELLSHREAAAAPASLQAPNWLPLKRVGGLQLHRPVGVWKELGALGLLSSISVSAWSKGSWLTAEEQWHDGILVPCLLAEASCYQRWESSPVLRMQLVVWRSSPVSIRPERTDIFSLKAVWWTRCLKTPLPYMIC